MNHKTVGCCTQTQLNKICVGCKAENTGKCNGKWGGFVCKEIITTKKDWDKMLTEIGNVDYVFVGRPLF